MPFTASVLHDDGLALLALAGELDVSSVSAVDAAVAQVLRSGLVQLVVDLSHLTFCDSSGLGALLRADRAVREAGGTCVVAGARGQVHRLTVLTHMARVLTLVPDVGRALTGLRDDAGRAVE